MFNSLKIIIDSIGDFLLSLWWIWLPLILFLLVKDLWLKNVREKFIKNMKWVFLEIKLPREVEKDARALEQIFAGLHGFHSEPNFKERFFGGKIQQWFSFELASFGGEIHFFVRALEKNRNQVEAQIYAQYPNVEIFEANDYTQSMSVDIVGRDYDLWGTDLILVKDDAYPIRTYPAFRKDIFDLKEIADPVASLLELLSKLQEGEQIWIQTLCKPILESKWEKKVEKVKNKLLGRIEEKKKGIIGEEISGLAEAAGEVIGQAVSGLPPGEKKAEKVAPAKISLLSTGEKDVVDAIEKKAAKVYYETIIRFIYLGKNEIYNSANVSAVFGCYKQFNTQNMNGFKSNKKIRTKINYKTQLKGPREFYRKKKILTDYRKRYFPVYSSAMENFPPLLYERLPIFNQFFIKSKPFVFNIEELATVYHFPSETVKAPTLPRVEAKKSEPPTGLPVQ